MSGVKDKKAKDGEARADRPQLEEPKITIIKQSDHTKVPPGTVVACPCSHHH